MKRQSIAEQTLSKQRKGIVERIQYLQTEIDKLGAEQNALVFLDEQLHTEIEAFKAARVKASELRKP